MPNIFYNSLSLGYGGGAPTPSYPTDGLIARYGFDGSTNDTFGNNNGFITYYASNPTPTWSYGEGKIEQAFVEGSAAADGASIYNPTDASVYTLFNGTNKFSVSAWVKITSGSADYQKVVVARTAATAMHSLISFGGASAKPSGSSNGCFCVVINNAFITAAVSNTDYRDNTWHHYAVVYDTSLAGFVDGENKFRNVAKASGNSANRVLLGSDNLSWDLIGSLDLLYFYNKALTEAEISTLYNSGAGI